PDVGRDGARVYRVRRDVRAGQAPGELAGVQDVHELGGRVHRKSTRPAGGAAIEPRPVECGDALVRHAGHVHDASVRRVLEARQQERRQVVRANVVGADGDLEAVFRQASGAGDPGVV